MNVITLEERPTDGDGPREVWAVHRKDTPRDGKLVRASNGEAAIDLVVRFYTGQDRRDLPTGFCEQLGCAPSDLTATRLPWLDDYRDLFGPDAAMARLRHGWTIPWYGGTGTGFLSLPEVGDTLDGGDVVTYAMHHDLPIETVYWMIAERIGATYPDRYRPCPGPRVWAVSDRSSRESEELLVRACTAAEAIRTAYRAVYRHIGRDEGNLQALESPWSSTCPNLSVLNLPVGPVPAPGGGGTGNSREGDKEPRTEQTKEEA